ncbi:MAG: CPBP family intramembrane metalloprotease [Rhodothermales bacterium]
MPEPTTAAPKPVLLDPWQPHHPIALTGWLERNRFSPLLVGILALVLTIIAFNIVGTFVTLIMLVAQGVGMADIQQDLNGAIATHIRWVLGANSIAQVLVIALPLVILVRWHTPDKASYIRLRKPEMGMMGLSLIGYIVFFPFFQWLGSINALLPLPEWMETLEASQLVLIESVFEQNLNVVFSVAMMALVPAICEELFFRGYLQRHFERAMPVLVAITLVGLLFGLFHLRLSQALPLAGFGVYLAYITWRTGSLWPAILVHFIHNGAMVVASKYVANSDTITFEQLEQMEMPWFLIVGSVALTALAIRMMQQRAERLIEAKTSLA